MVLEIQRLKEEILVSLSAASDHRLRPHDVERTLSHRFGISAHTIHQGVKDLVEEGKLVYTYRDPDSYIEVAEGIRLM
jgi:DNA-binding GntR family transcriptional regulator